MLTLLTSLALTASVAGCGLLGGDDADARGGGRTFTVAAAGDILMHPQLIDQARKDAERTGKGVAGVDFGPLMAGIKPVISKADLAICHLEPVLGKPKGPFESYPNFLVPPQVATTIKDIGYDTCSTASNHSLDHGYKGVKRTLDTLDAAGVKHTGSFRTQRDSLTPLVMDVNGVKIAQISFAFGFNAHELPANKPWLVNQTDLGRIKAAEQRARKAGAEVVILSLHWGREHHPDPSTPQLKFAREIAQKTGIDLVIGHHAHVVQPMEKVDGTWIAYGLGNQVARHDVPTGLTEEGVIGWFTFTERGGKWEVEPRFEPTLVEIPPDLENAVDGSTVAATADDAKDYRLVDVAAALRDGDLTDKQRARLRLAFKRTEGTLLNRGAAKDGLEALTSLPE
ncbi:PGA biosynthesis protein CapA [Streptomyces colonosanans]|uniref:PGA biosynthesis protein CapA n=1 Tax=Streptomyces colonosanans TaxID=1428652 RepID=A0A1S2PCW4_9ACTN|nr:PGA biosynthesis protein CapA [Streptomyces colonosanans]